MMSDAYIEQIRHQLLEHIIDKSFNYSEEPIFRLVSGRMSNYYIDCKKTTLSADAIDLLGSVMYEQIKDLEAEGIGGLTLGADPIAYATSLTCKLKGKIIHPFIVRKTPKDHGIIKWIEGNVKPEDRVIIIEDVITTGQSTMQAIERSREAGLKVIQIIALVDREEGGRQEISKHAYPFKAVFTRSELIQAFLAKKNKRSALGSS